MLAVEGTRGVPAIPARITDMVGSASLLGGTCTRCHAILSPKEHP
jgi:hypothetical protein